jgi:hypothetical protein
MGTLAGLSDNLETQVAVKARDLSGSRQFLEIAELYHAAGSSDDALAWAERGLAAFPDDHDGSLVGFVIDEYLDRGPGSACRGHGAGVGRLHPKFRLSFVLHAQGPGAARKQLEPLAYQGTR